MYQASRGNARRTWMFLALACILLLVLPSAAGAATATQDGLTATLTTDRSSYAIGDTATVSFSVTNTNAFAVSNVQLALTLPDGLAYQSGDRNLTIPSLAAGETQSTSLTAKATDGSSTTPPTGDDSPLLLLMALLLAAGAGLVLTRKKAARFFALLLGLLLGLPVLAPAPAIAANDARSFSISQTVSSDASNWNIRLNVNYDWNTNYVPVTGISVSPVTLSLVVGGSTGSLTATLQPAGATNQVIAWTSSNAAAATVANDGTVTPVAPGIAIITATTVEGFNASCAVTVYPAGHIPVTGLVVYPSEIDLMAGGPTLQLAPQPQPLNATDRRVRWYSDNSAVATVDSSGVVTPVAVGTAVITATSLEGGYQATSTITVLAGYRITMADDGNGTATADYTDAPAGTRVTITATPNDPARHQFARWFTNDATLSGSHTVSPSSFIMPANPVTIEASFSPTNALRDANAAASTLTGFNAFSSYNTPTTLYFDAVFTPPLPSNFTVNFVSTNPPLSPAKDPLNGGLTLNTNLVVEAADLSAVTLTYTVTDTHTGVTSDEHTIDISSLLGPTTTAGILRATVPAIEALDNYHIASWNFVPNYVLPITLPISISVSAPPAETAGLPAPVTVANLYSQGTSLQIYVNAFPMNSGTFAFPSVTVNCDGTSYVITGGLTITMDP